MCFRREAGENTDQYWHYASILKKIIWRYKMGSLGFLAAGYAVFWIVAFVFIYSMVSRQRKLEKEVTMLEQLTQNEGQEE
jgi:CcmD family protein